MHSQIRPYETRRFESHRLFLWCVHLSLERIWRTERKSRAHNVGRESFPAEAIHEIRSKIIRTDPRTKFR